MMILGLLFENPDLGALTSTGWGALIYTALVGMTICYLTWFATLRYLPPAMARPACCSFHLSGSRPLYLVNLWAGGRPYPWLSR
jgi:drug/metabolite transporter (DMT)-like permease